jgi:Na+-transporting methylmalonyl-CoA/oxaloacetate decarboxylase gamma subunit
MKQLKSSMHNYAKLYEIGLIELSVLFSLVFLIYTMPISVYRFSKSFFGKLIILLAIFLSGYRNISHGIVLAVLFLLVSEIGRMEGFTEVEGTEVEGTEVEGTEVEGMENKDKKDKTDKVQDSKTAFIKDHCGAKRTTFDLETIQKDYMGLVFTDGVCDPCDTTCRYKIDNTNDSLYNFDINIAPKDDVQQ